MIHLVGNMVEIPDSASCCTHTGEDTIIFVGKMSYDPNVVAVTYFTKEIYPKLKEQFPNLKFIIIGSTPINKVKELEKINGVEVTGFVDSIEPYFQNTSIVVAPMLTGAGIQNKIIQAMAHGCCVATTPIGAEGLTIKNEEIKIFNDSADWINGLAELLKDQDKRKFLGQKAREYVINNLSESIIKEEFNRFIEDGLSKK